jgi:7-carboxy-7-deazaguanine synthase
MILRLNETFQSLDGEVSPFYQGCISTFVRTSGCSLHCKYCDTEYANHPQPSDRIFYYESEIESFFKAHILRLKSPKITITGGEPMLWEQGVNLLIELCLKNNIGVTIETNGSILPSKLFKHSLVSYIVDYKLPSSGMEEHMNLPLFTKLSKNDIVKFVMGDYKDFLRFMIVLKKLDTKAKIAVSPIFKTLDPQLLVGWMTRHQILTPIVNIQIHKYIKVK